MPAHSTTEEYFSGQGVVMVALRDAGGSPKGFRLLGNCPGLSLKNAITNLEHKESTTGARGTDLRLVTELKSSVEIILENFKSTNIAQDLRGSVTERSAGTVTDEACKGYMGLVSSVANIKVSSFVLKKGATTLTAYTTDSAAWDYIVNTDAGSFKINDGKTLAFANIGVAATAIAVGATTEVTIANTAVAGDTFYFGQGWTGADAALLNGKSATVISATSTAVILNIVTTGKTLTVGTNKCIWSGIALLASYSYAVQQQIDALTEGSTEYFLRFEGLNTAHGNIPVIVEIFRFVADPAESFDLISDGVQQFSLKGSALKDGTRLTGSAYYRVIKQDLGS